MKRILRAVRRRLRRIVGGPPPPSRRTLPLTRDAYPRLGGDVTVPDVAGRLLLVRLGEDGTSEGRHRTVFVPGPEYGGMEDNDIRGLLDGTFFYGWNQVDQKYVRAGRIDDVFKYGEYELFRILHRWDGLSLPEGAAVDEVELRLVPRPDEVTSVRTLFLYAVREDWDPGRGGVDRNNASPPTPGAVWWNDRRFGEAQWEMPGASSDRDLDPAPLARFALAPGAEAVVFRSEALTRYASRRIEAGEPLLFLLKLQDHQEDVPGSLTYIWSATEGDDRSPGRKPRLTVWWRARETVLLDTELLLEHGRSRVLPAEGAHFAELVLDDDSGTAELAARSADGAWRPLVRGRLEEHDRELRVRAVTGALVHGQPFVASYRDTWVTTKAPEDQRVSCSLVSPTGRHRQVQARYEGDFTWVVEFIPDEVGRWRYQWRHHLQPTPHFPREESFDVVVETVPQAVSALKHFLSLALAADFGTREELSHMMVGLSKVERAALAQLTPSQFRGEEGAAVLQLIREIRRAFGSPAPDEIPMVAIHPPPWERG